MTSPSAAVLTWLSRLVALDTTSRDSNLPLIELVADHARSLGLNPRVFPTAEGRKANLIVTVPAHDGGTAGGVMLSGHSDVVPVDGQRWASDPFALSVRGDRAYGRGTADMKGFDAVVVAALEHAVERPLAEPLHVALTYDEEVGCLGAPPLVASLRAEGLSPRVCFVGEPTSMRMIRGHKSINVVKVTLTGVAAHSSLTTQGVNAVEHAAEVVSFWRRRCERWRSEGPFDDAYPIAYTTGSVNLIAGGTGVNIIPAECAVTLEFRGVAATSADAEIDGLRAFCRQVEGRMRAEASGHDEAPDAAPSVVVDVLSQTVGLDAPEDGPAVALGRVLGLEVRPDKVTYGTEAGVFADAGISTVVCGPGDIAQAHKADEFVELDQLARCERFVAGLVDHVRARP